MSKYVFNLTGPEMEAALNKATKVVANPEITGSEAALESIEIADTKYKLGGSSAVWGQITGDLNDQTDLQSSLSAKQDTLVSGTNIKTINNESILGSGNIEIQGGGGLPTPANAGDAMVYNGTEWAKQANYGYTAPATGADLTWDGDITGKDVSKYSRITEFMHQKLYKINSTPFVFADFKDDDTFTITAGAETESIAFSDLYVKVTTANADFLLVGDEIFLVNIKTAGSGEINLSDFMIAFKYENAEAGIYVNRFDDYYLSRITCNHVEVATWNGETTGLFNIILNGAQSLTVYKVNDPITSEAFKSATSITFVYRGEPEEIPISDCALFSFSGADIFMLNVDAIINATQAGTYSFWYGGLGYKFDIAITEPGLYFSGMNGGYYKFKFNKLKDPVAMYISKLTLADSSTVPNPAWDGEISGHTAAALTFAEENHAYKISANYNYTFADFKTCSSIKISGESKYISEDYFNESEHCYIYSESRRYIRIICAKQAGTFTVTNNDGNFEITVPSPGMYFYSDGEEYVSEFKFGIPEHVVKINESYIPTNPMVDNAVEYNGLGIVDFATTASTLSNEGGSGSVVLTNIETSQTHIINKGSELHPSKYAKSFINQILRFSLWDSVQITADSIFTDNNALAIIYNNSIRVFEIQKATTSAAPGYITIDGINYSYVGEPGTYFYSTTSVNYLAPIYNKIDEIFLSAVDSGAGTFIAEYGTTTYSAILAAYNIGKSIYCKYTESNITSMLTIASVGNNKITFTQAVTDSSITPFIETISVTSNDSWQVIKNNVQKELISGTNIKTINSESILGPGNIAFIAENVTYSTVEPTAPNPDGIKFAVLDEEPATKFTGWFYIITE